jgi:Domain of unknown function (DUF927)
MSRLDFLSAVLPQNGWYCTLGIFKGVPNQQFVDSFDALLVWADMQSRSGIDAFYGLATYKDTSERKTRNVLAYKSLWMDLDIGKGTEYASKKEGLSALKRFTDTVKLPTPTVVSSGYGLHVYWTFDNEISYNEWKPLATALKNRVNSEGFRVKDASLTTDPSRVLRIPDTKNFKHDTQVDVKLIMLSDSAPVDYYRTILEADMSSPLALIEMTSRNPGSTINDTTRALLGNVVFKFNRIMRRSIRDDGCNQLKHIYLNQNEISEPLWRSGLSIAQFCEDRETAIHKISNRHDEYDPAATEIKARGIAGPHHCDTFKNQKPDLCEGCKYAGLITTPIVLGKDILEATPTDNLITAISQDLGVVDVEIPEYPYPYFRGPKGGVYAKIKKLGKGMDAGNGDAEDVDKLPIYEHDFYMVGRRTDPDLGEVVHMRLIRPHDGISDFTAPLAAISSLDRCRDLLSQRGIAADMNGMKGILGYLVAWTKYLQNVSRAELVRSQFGWADMDQAFIIGSREYSKNRPPKYSPPSAATERTVPLYSKEGSLEMWRSVVNNFAKPGNEVRAFALFLSLGAPMFKSTALGGAILHLTNASSGVGKSTVQMVANSVWGHPVKTMLTKDDTTLSKFHRMGVVQSMVVCIDEITNYTALEVSNLAFGATNGRGKNRMEASANSERINVTTWQMPCITSGNNSLHEVLHSVKADPEGEIMRVLELEVVRNSHMSKQESDRVFSRELQNNYGHAGELMVQYMLNSYDDCIDRMHEIQKKFDTRAGLSQRERYYSALCATAFLGGTLANELKIINIPVEPVMAYIANAIGHTVAAIQETETSMSAHLGAFMSEHIQNQLIINNTPPPMGLSVPIETPKGALVMRREPDTQRLYIASAVLKKWCASRQIAFKCLVESLTASGLALGQARVRMSKGTPQDSSGVIALVIDASKID